MQTVNELNLGERTVFMRLDLNVPMRDGRVASDARLEAALPTIRHAIAAGAKLALASHMGRPKGKPDPRFSLEPVAVRLSQLLKQDVAFSSDCMGDGVKGLMRNCRPGGVVVLENLRFHNGEKENDPQFANALKEPFEVYVNDAFGSSHRSHASIVGMVKHFSAENRAVGFLMGKEVEALRKVIVEPAKPFVAVLGGSKVSDKVGVLESLVSKASVICIGGAMAYTLIKAQGLTVGTSQLERDKLHVASSFLERARLRGVEVVLPVDHWVANDFNENAEGTLASSQHVPEGTMGLDIGPATQKLFAEHVNKAATVFWNGPMGVFEWEKYSGGTKAMAEALATCEGYTVVGGGDSVAAVEMSGLRSNINHVSTGGGASLELIQHGTLPGIEAVSAG